MDIVFDVNVEDWEKEILQHDTLLVIDFWHDRCHWCHMLEPIFEEVAKKYKNKLKFAKFNVLKNEKHQDLAIKYGIMGTPTIIFFCDGRPVETITGFQPKEQLIQLVENAIATHKECIKKSTKL